MITHMRSFLVCMILYCFNLIIYFVLKEHFNSQKHFSCFYITHYIILVSAYKCVFLFPDVYVFGIGEKVKLPELKQLASIKMRERHLFVLRNYEHLGEVFNRMISEYHLCMLWTYIVCSYVVHKCSRVM